MRRKHGGFTLAELLIVLAILAVLIGIAIPVYSSTLEGSRKTVCEANQRMIVSGYNTLAMLTDWPSDHEAQEALAVKYLEDELRETFSSRPVVCQRSRLNPTNSDPAKDNPIYEYVFEGLCPSGGVFRIRFSKDRSEVASFICDKHKVSGEQAAANIGTLYDTLKDPNSTLVRLIYDPDESKRLKSRADFPLPIGMTNISGFSQAFIDAAYDVGIDLSGGSWSLRRDSDKQVTLYFTQTDLSTLPLNSTQPVAITRYVIQFKTVSGARVLDDATEHTGSMTVKAQTTGGKTYNTLDTVVSGSLVPVTHP